MPKNTSYPPDMLYWWGGAGPGFYCRESDGCLDQILDAYYVLRTDGTDDPDGMVGPTLKEELARRDAAPEMLEQRNELLESLQAISYEFEQVVVVPTAFSAFNNAKDAIAKARGSIDV